MVIHVNGAVWRKSTYSGDNGGGCVEVSTSAPDTVSVRDSKDKNGPRLTVSNQAWSGLVQGIKHGEFGL